MISAVSSAIIDENGEKRHFTAMKMGMVKIAACFTFPQS